MNYAALTSLLVLSMESSAVPTGRPYCNVPPHATVYKGKLYGFFGIPGKQSPFGLTEYMPFAIPTDNPDPKKWEMYLPGAGGYGFRHRVNHNCVWFMHGYGELCRLRGDELPLFD